MGLELSACAASMRAAPSASCRRCSHTWRPSRCCPDLDIFPRIPVREFLDSILFLRNYIFGSWYTGHFWSLAVEEHFYMFAPVFILLCRRKLVLRVTPLLILGCIIIRWFEYQHHMFAGTLIQFRTENRYDGLLWGCMMAFAFDYPQLKDRLRKFLNWPVIMTLFVSVVVLLTAFSAEPFRRTLVAMTIPVFIAFTLLRPDTLASRFLEIPLLKWLGRISYSLYLWQSLFLPESGRPLGFMQVVPWAYVGALTCAVISFYVIETPFIRWGHQLAAAATGPDPKQYRETGEEVVISALPVTRPQSTELA